ncbi:hypothetical protein AVEN_207025-1 [Araneus ventricosus]|uniref:Uncharacterized protein n=1 Tax=Araneus ventricosus TaxID=182803 RepID=A0A4Y2GQG7_ARAVE|nr:hypothetical protein AVEN_207025-1 [Araneus ventricosus]
MTAAAIASSTQTVFLVVHHRAMTRPLQQEVPTITGGGTQSLTTTIPTGEATSCLLIRQQVIYVKSRRPLRDEIIVSERHITNLKSCDQCAEGPHEKTFRSKIFTAFLHLFIDSEVTSR